MIPGARGILLISTALVVLPACGARAPAIETGSNDTPERQSPTSAEELAASAAPAWVSRLVEVGAGTEDAAGLEEFVVLAGREFGTRMLLEMSPGQQQEGRVAIEMLIRLEWDPVIDGDEEFRDPEFRAALARATIGGLVALLSGHLPQQQIDRLRCELLDRQLRSLRRDALAAAKRRFDGEIDDLEGSELGMDLALKVELFGTQDQNLRGRCEGGDLRAADLANSRLDVGFLVGGDPCDTLSWDVYIHIQAKDDLLPVAERTLGGDCKPNVLVLD